MTQTTVYVEGILPHGTTEGSPITLMALNADKKVVAQHTVTVVVAQPIFAFFGGGPIEAAKQAIDNYLATNAVDQRRADSAEALPAILQGSTNNQTPIYYSVDVCTQIVQCGHLAKIALQTEGADVLFNGHANSGLGLSFVSEGELLATTDDFFNMTGKRNTDSTPTIAGIEWAMELSTNGPVSITADQVPETVENYMVLPDIVNQLKFSNDPEASGGPPKVGDGEWFLLTSEGTTPMPDLWYHYEYTLPDDEAHKFLLVSSGSEDVPPLHYRSLLLYLCSPGRHFLETFQHGQMFYTTNDTSGDEIPVDFVTKHCCRI